MLRFGILATLIWHYSVDALYTAFVLLRAPNHYLMVSGALTAGVMLVPLIVSLVAYWRSGTFADESALTNASVGIARAPRREAVAEPEAPLAYRALDTRRLVLAAMLVAAFIALALVPVHRFGEGTKLRLNRQEAMRVADEYLRQRQVDPSRYRQAAWLRENVDALALKYILQRRTVEEADRIYRQATRLVLWEVRYFRPLEKEEHHVFIDAAGGGAFSYRRVLDEDAPGATLSPEDARARAAELLERSGYQLGDFVLQESKVNKRKARTDYTLVWQAKPDSPNNYMQVDDAYFRLEVDVAGDQVVGLARYFKLPEVWQRQQSATTLTNAILLGVLILLAAGLLAGGLVLFVLRVRRGEIRWRPAAYAGAVVAGVLALAALNRLPNLYQRYSTSEPLTTFWISNAAALLVWPFLGGLVGWLLVGLATSLYPEAWRIFRGAARRLWRRDAAIAIVVSLAAATALNRISALIAGRFHAHAPVGVDLVPDLFDASWPGVGFLLRGLLYSLFVPAMAAVLIYLFRLGWTRRAWWLWIGGFLVLVSLGPSFAHSVPEFFVGWALSLIGLVVAIGIVAAFYRDNVLAYVGAALCLLLARPLVELMWQPAAFFRWNGLILGILMLALLGWLLLPRSGSAEN
jgi:hypothetical protein